MREILEKLIKKKKITEKDIEYALYEICDEIHHCCNDDCPIYDLIYSGDMRDCKYHKNGKAMLKAIRKVIK